MSVPAASPARAPGVMVEWVSADVPVPAAVRTDVAGFVGIAQRGPVHQPIRVASWSQFQAVFGDFVGRLATRGRRALCRRDDRSAGGGGFIALVVVEQHRRQRLAHVPFDVVGEHAKQHMAADAIGQAMVDRADFQIDRLQRPEGALRSAEVFV